LCTGEETKDPKKAGMKDGKKVSCFVFLYGIITVALDGIIMKLAFIAMASDHRYSYSFEAFFQ